MPSIISGYSYDIFISYRQKDNKGDRWVTGFIDALKTELESTFKEDISIYFDENPHDGLHDHHSVDDSLREKLKCLIFIPVVSRTYCDPKSFAWDQEFKVFLSQAAVDSYGLKVKLPNGNVASRVLPIRIHDLPPEDVRLFEAETQGVLRPIDFIYKGPGINRSLVPSDKKEENTNHTIYRDQVNKVANAIEEIISGLRQAGSEPHQVHAGKPVASSREVKQSIQKSPIRKIAAATIILLALLAAGWWYWTLFHKDAVLSDSIRQSRIAVLPFENKTNDPALDMLGDMAADWIIQGLMNLDEVQVVSYQTIKDNLQYASLAGGVDNDFAKRTGAQKIIKGRIYKQGDQLIVQSQILDAVTGEMELALPEIQGKSSDLQGLVKSLRDRMMTKFAMAKSKTFQPYLEANPPTYEAFKYFELAQTYFGIDYPKCREFLYKAIIEDSTYAWAYLQIGWTFGNQGMNGKVDSLLKVVDRKFPNLPFYEKTYLEAQRENLNGNVQGALEQIKKVYQKDPKQFLNSYLAGLYSSSLNRPSEAVKYFGSTDPESIEIEGPTSTWWHNWYSLALIRAGRLEEALTILGYVPDEKAVFGIFAARAYIYMLKNQPDSLRNLLSRLKTLGLDGNPYSSTCNAIAQKYALRNDLVNKIKWANMSLDYLVSLPKADKDGTWAFSYYMAGQLQESLTIYEQLYRKDPRPIWLTKIGCLNAKLGKRTVALSTATALETMNVPFPNGRIKYGLARIYASLGEKEKAFDLMMQAFKEGWVFDFGSYDYDFEFLPLFDYPPFQEFVKPKG